MRFSLSISVYRPKLTASSVRTNNESQIVTEMRISIQLTLQHGVFLSVTHSDCGLIRFCLVGANRRLDVTKLALVDELLLLAPLSIEKLAAHQALVFHI